MAVKVADSLEGMSATIQADRPPRPGGRVSGRLYVDAPKSRAATVYAAKSPWMVMFPSGAYGMT